MSARRAGAMPGGDASSLHYQTVVAAAAKDAAGPAGVAEGFFDLANAEVVRYTLPVPSVGRGVIEKPRGDGTYVPADGVLQAGGRKCVSKRERDHEVEDAGPTVELRVRHDQSLHDSCGGIVWESAFCLAGYLRRRAREGRAIARGKRFARCDVVELGAGCGLLGMVASALGAKNVIVTDHPDAMPLLRKNVDANEGALREAAEAHERTRVALKAKKGDGRARGVGALPLDWTSDEHLSDVVELGPYDVVLATDVVFNESLVAPLVRCIRRCLRRRDGVAFVCLQERCPDAFRAFRKTCEEHFEVREIPGDDVGFVDEECVLFELRFRPWDGKDAEA